MSIISKLKTKWCAAWAHGKLEILEEYGRSEKQKSFIFCPRHILPIEHTEILIKAKFRCKKCGQIMVTTGTKIEPPKPYRNY